MARLPIFVALPPQFVDPSGPWPLTLQLAVLGMAFTLTCTVFYPCLGTVAQALFLCWPAATRIRTMIFGVSMVLIGAALIAERFAG